MGILNDLAMGFGTRDRDLEYYERTAETMGRPSQGGSPERQAMYRSQMGLDDGATVDNGRLSQKSLLGKAVNAIGSKGGGKVENPAETTQSMRPQMRDIPNMRPQMRPNPYGDHSTNYGGGGGETVPISQMNQELYGYDYPSYKQTSSPLYAQFEQTLLPQLKKEFPNLTETEAQDMFEVFKNRQMSQMKGMGFL